MVKWFDGVRAMAWQFDRPHLFVDCPNNQGRFARGAGRCNPIDKIRGLAKVKGMGEGQSRMFRVIPLVCAALAMVLGLMTFIGWISAMPLLASVRSNYIPMAPSTALCFSLIGTGLVLEIFRPGWKIVIQFLAGVVLLMACAKIVEVSMGSQLGIDVWFVRDPEMFGAVRKGRMAPMTAINFVFVAMAMLSLTSPRRAGRACTLAALATVVSVVILVGYWYGTPLLYGGSIIPVALPTACGFFLCGTGIMAAAGPDAWPLRTFLGGSTRALLLRAFVPVIILVSLVNGWIRAMLLERQEWNPALISAFSTLVFATLITLIVCLVSRKVGGRIDSAEEARNRAQEALVMLNAELETRVRDRTRQLSEVNEQMHEDLRMARELQAALLPREFPTVPPNVSDRESALRFLSLYFPTGDVSGDFFSVFPVGADAVGVLICDVMGHGVRSALITSMIRGLVEEYGRSTTDPGELLTRINQALNIILKQADTTMFATCFYVVADVANAEMRFSNAGHPCALHFRTGDESAEKLQGVGRRGPALGLFPSITYATSTTPMEEGDLVMLFTDGLFEVEGADGESFSEEQLQETVSRHASLPPEEFFVQVLNEVRGFSNRESFDDDVCVVGMKVQRMNSI